MSFLIIVAVLINLLYFYFKIIKSIDEKQMATLPLKVEGSIFVFNLVYIVLLSL
jgi:hypothetical protein